MRRIRGNVAPRSPIERQLPRRAWYRRSARMIGIPNRQKQEESLSTYHIAVGYRHRQETVYFDDTALTDEWQREVYLEAATLMARNQLSTVYDVGCGSGYKLITYLGQYDTIGFDLPETVAFLRKKYPDRKWISELSDVGTAKADLVICADVIEHVLDPNILLDFLTTVCGHYLVLSTPDRSLLHSQKSDLFLGPPMNPYHVREWTFDEFAAYISEHFDIVNHCISNVIQATQMIVCRPNH